MSSQKEWAWKIHEAADRIRNRYSTIGKSTGAPFLAVVYPPEVQAAVDKEWKTLVKAMGDEFDIRTIDVQEVTMSVIKDLGLELITGSLENPMPGSNAETELGHLWVSSVAKAIRENAPDSTKPKMVVVLQNLAALYPVAGPRALMQELWESDEQLFDGPILFFIPGTLKEPRVYSFLNLKEEFMYRGDVL